MTYIFRIIDTCVKVNLLFDLSYRWHDFITNEYKKGIEVNLLFSSDNNYYGLYNIKSFLNGVIVYSNEGGLLASKQNWEKACLYANNYEQSSSLVLVQLYSYLLTRRTLLIHSSLIDHHGNGILFLGPSGIGKTTQAELWNRYRGADILNGDMVFVRQWEDGFYGYGSPWHGSSPYYKNAKVKLKAMITLEQAPENSIRKLSGFEVLQGMMDQVFLPHWYPEAMDDCLSTLDALLSEVPIYHLACRPDEDAVRLVEQELGL